MFRLQRDTVNHVKYMDVLISYISREEKYSHHYKWMDTGHDACGQYHLWSCRPSLKWKMSSIRAVYVCVCASTSNEYHTVHGRLDWLHYCITSLWYKNHTYMYSNSCMNNFTHIHASFNTQTSYLLFSGFPWRISIQSELATIRENYQTFG